MRRTLTSRARGAVLAGGLALGLVALGLAVVPTAGAAGSVAQCSTADLSAQLKAGSPGAGQRYATVVLTNTSTHSCTLGGYGGLGLLGAPRQGVPTDLRRIASPSPTTLTVSPDGSVRSLLHWTVIAAADEPEATCEPTAVTVVVTPPNQTRALLRPWTFGPVCQHGLIWQNTYVAGSAAF
jgi:Protein of unknown function (DUF4232)